MKKPVQFSENKKNNPVLIVDKPGILGNVIAEELSKELLVVFVGQKRNEEEKISQNLIHIPYPGKFPQIPDNNYSYIIIFDESDPGVSESLSSFIKKAEKDESVLVYIASLSEESQKLSKKIISAYKNAKAIIYGDVFGKEEGLSFVNPVNYVIRQAVRNKKIKIPGEGLTRIFPVLFDDLKEGILNAIFSSHKSKIFFLFAKDPKTLISLAHIIQKKNPDIKVDFTREKPAYEKTVTIDGEYLLGKDYKIEEGIKEIDFEDLDKEEFEVGKDSGEKEERSLKNFIYPFILLIFILALPALSTLFFLSLGLFELSELSKNIDRKDVRDISKRLRNIDYLLDAAYKSSKPLVYEANLVGQSENVSNLTDKITFYKKLSHAGRQAAYSALIIEEVLKGEAKNPRDSILLFISSYKNSLALLEESKIDNSDFSGKIKKYEPLLNMFYTISDTIYPLINPNGQRTYLVLFQNNMELRPSGGFIGSYGILTLNKGKFKDFSIHDVYDADGQLKGHVEPPYPIRRYLPSVHLYLRDSNFDLDFNNSASTSANLLFLETGERVDGVIGIDVSFVKELVGATGGVSVPDYNEKVNAQNFFETVERQAEKDFFPSSTGKKDFLGALFRALASSLSERKNLPYVKIFEAVLNSISEKHVVFAHQGKRVQNVLQANNWAGSIKDLKSKSSVNDFVGVNEANLGVNKTNFFIGRSVKYEVGIKDSGEISSSVTLNLKNSSPSKGADYKTYLRFITPHGSTLSSVTIDGKAQKIVNAVTDPLVYEAKNFRPPQGLEVEKYDQEQKSVYGFLTIVAPGKVKSVVLKYLLPQKLSIKDQASSYSLRIFKQPGTDSYPFDVLVSYPKSFSLSSSFKLNDQEGRAVVSKIISTDETLVFNLSKK